MSRNLIIKLRVSEHEHGTIAALAADAGMTISDFIRLRTMDFRLRKSAVDRDKIRQLARIGANMNQVARWVNLHKKRAETMEVILHLDAISEQLKKLAEDECT